MAGLPQLLAGFSPAVAGLADFLWDLAATVEWSREKACLQGVAKALARYYARPCQSLPCLVGKKGSEGQGRA